MIEGIKELVVGIMATIAGITLTFRGSYKIITILAQGVAIVFLVLIILFLTSVASRALISLFEYLEEEVLNKESLWNVLVTALQKPAIFIIWIVGVSFALDIIHFATTAQILAVVPTIRSIAIIAALVWFFIQFIKSWIKKPS